MQVAILWRSFGKTLIEVVPSIQVRAGNTQLIQRGHGRNLRSFERPHELLLL